MALPSVGGGYQYTDGNQSEQIIGVQAAPQTATASATLSVAQITGGILVGSPSGTAAAYTLPTAALIDATMTNMKVNSTFSLVIISLGTGVGLITVTTATGLTLVGSVIVGITAGTAGQSGAAEFLFRKTGDAAYSVYRVA